MAWACSVADYLKNAYVQASTIQQRQHAFLRPSAFVTTTLPAYIAHHVQEDIEQFSVSGRFPLDIKQLSPGPFRGRTTVITLPGCTLTRRFTSARHSSACWVPQAATLMFPLGGQHAFVQGRLRDASRQIGSLGNHEVYSVIPENYGHLLVTLPLETLARHLDPSESSLFVETLAGIEGGEIDAKRKMELTSRLLQIFVAIERAHAPLPAEALDAYSAEITQLLFAYLAAHAGRDPVRSSNHEKILQRALGLIAAQPDKLFTLDELAREVFASKRAVQYAFGCLLGMSPMRFQKLYRLNLIRRELLLATTPLKFAGLVSTHAFSNPGRTSREYAELFGERPSDTLRKALSGIELPAGEG